MFNRLVNLALVAVLLFAEQALAQEPVKESRAESLCFGQCGGTGLIHGLEVGTYLRRPLLPVPPDVQLPSPPYGPKTWSPWVVCMSLGISPSGTLVCRQWGYGRSPWAIPLDGFDANGIRIPSCPENVFIRNGGYFGPGLPTTYCRSGDSFSPYGSGIHGRIRLY